MINNSEGETNEKTSELKIGAIVEFGKIDESCVIRRHNALPEQYLVKKGLVAFPALKQPDGHWEIQKGQVNIRPDRKMEIVAKL